MTAAKAEDASQLEPLAILLDALGDANWRKRQAAVDQLIAHPSPALISPLTAIIRNESHHLSRLNAAIQILACTELDVNAALLALLTDSHVDVRAAAALTLGERGDVAAIDSLIAALADADTNVRAHAIEALGKLHAVAAVDALIQLVEVLDFELAFPALDALAAIGDRRIAHRLVPLLQDALMRDAVIQTLGKLGDEETIVWLLSWLTASADTALKAAVAIHQIHQRYVTSYDSFNIAKLVRRSNEASIVAALSAAIGDSSPAEKHAVVDVLGMLSGPAAEDVLLDLLDEPALRQSIVAALSMRSATLTGKLLERYSHASRESRLGFIEIFGRIADRGPVPLLLQCLRDEDEAIALQTLDALARLGDARFYPHALDCLRHSSLRIRQAAVVAINSLGHPSTAADMQRLLSDSSASVRESAVKIAGYFGFAQCVDALLACCEHPQERIRRTAIEHLVCLDDPRILSRLLFALRSDSAPVRAAAAGAFGELPPGVAISALLEAVKDSDVWVRYYAVRSLAKVDQSELHQETLLSLARNDRAMQVRIAAIESFSASAVTALAEFAVSAEDDLATAALRALGVTKQAAALPALLEAVDSDRPLCRAQALRSLGELGLPAAVDVLQTTAMRRRDPHWQDATQALGMIRCGESVLALLSIARDPAKRVIAKAALIALGEPVVKEFAWHLRQGALEVRLIVVEVLIGIRTTSAIEALETALSDSEPAVRHLTLSGLANIRCLHKASSASLCREGSV